MIGSTGRASVPVLLAWVVAGPVLAADGRAAGLEQAVGQAESWLEQGRLEQVVDRLEPLLRLQAEPVGLGPSDDGATAALLGRAWALLAEAQERRGQFAAELRARTHEIAQWSRAVGAAHPVVLGARVQRALALRRLQQPREAETALREVLAQRMALLPVGAMPAARDHLLLARLFLMPQRRLAEAEAAVRQALQLLQSAAAAGVGVTPADLLPCRLALAAILLEQGRAEDAQSVLLRVLAVLDEQGAPALPKVRLDALRQLGEVQMVLGQPAPAERTLRAALEVAAVHPGPRDIDLDLARTRLAEVLVFQERPAEALVQVMAVLDSRRRGVRGAFHPDLLAIWTRIGDLLIRLGRAREAADLLARLVEETRAQRGAQHPETAQALASLARAQHETGLNEAAERHLRIALDIEAAQPAGALTEGRMAGLRNQLGLVLLAQGRPAEAAPVLRQALQAEQSLRSATSPDIVTLQSNLALALRQQGLLGDAAAVLRQALAAQESLQVAAPSRQVDLLQDLGAVLAEMQDLPAAEAALNRAIEIRRRQTGDPRDLRLARLQGALGRVWVQAGRLSEAEATLQASLILLEAADPADPDLPGLLVSLGGLHRRRGEFDLALARVGRAVDLRRLRWGRRAGPTAIAEIALAQVLDAAGRSRAAEPLLRQVLEVLDRGGTRGTPAVAQAHLRLAEVHLHAGRFPAAAGEARSALQIYERTYGLAHPDAVACRDLLGVAKAGGRPGR